MAPTGLTVIPRDRRFGREPVADRHWLNGDPITTAFFNAMSVIFLRGEAFFIDSVRAFRDGVPPKLAAEIAAFIKQEVVHSRENLAFNRQVSAHGYEPAGPRRDYGARPREATPADRQPRRNNGARTFARPWMKYFLLGFHLWKLANRALIALADSPYADAKMATA